MGLPFRNPKQSGAHLQIASTGPCFGTRESRLFHFQHHFTRLASRVSRSHLTRLEGSPHPEALCKVECQSSTFLIPHSSRHRNQAHRGWKICLRQLLLAEELRRSEALSLLHLFAPRRRGLHRANHQRRRSHRRRHYSTARLQ